MNVKWMWYAGCARNSAVLWRPVARRRASWVPIEPIRFAADQVTFDPELSGSYPTQGVDAFCSSLLGYVTARIQNKPSR
jgi:hypothetical protein